MSAEDRIKNAKERLERERNSMEPEAGRIAALEAIADNIAELTDVLRHLGPSVKRGS